MRIEPCPVCGRRPVVEELHERPKGIRRRMCHCPNLCSVIPCVHKEYYQFAFIYVGNGDSNTILRKMRYSPAASAPSSRIMSADCG